MATNPEVLGVQEHKWTRSEYEQIAAAGVFAPDARLELVDGAIFTMTPQSSRHATAVHLVADVLRQIAPADTHIRIQSPLALGSDSEPEPDIALIHGSPRRYSEAHPQTALLVVEVADSSLHHDQVRKRLLYARHQIPEYWIIDLTTEQVETYRDPQDGDYRTMRVLYAGDVVVLSSSAGEEITGREMSGTIPVRELLP